MKEIPLKEIIDRLKDDKLALHIAKDCKDPAHDFRYCSTCENRLNAIEEYREIIMEKG